MSPPCGTVYVTSTEKSDLLSKKANLRMCKPNRSNTHVPLLTKMVEIITTEYHPILQFLKHGYCVYPLFCLVRKNICLKLLITTSHP